MTVLEASRIKDSDTTIIDKHQSHDSMEGDSLTERRSNDSVVKAIGASEYKNVLDDAETDAVINHKDARKNDYAAEQVNGIGVDRIEDGAPEYKNVLNDDETETFINHNKGTITNTYVAELVNGIGADCTGHGNSDYKDVLNAGSETEAFIDHHKDVRSDEGNTEAVDEVEANNLGDNADFRIRILHTACIFWTMAIRGWRFALVGPTFPDLRLLVKEDLATASWIFTAWEFGGLLGAATSGYLYDRFNKLHIFILLTLILSISTVLTPWCTQFAWMVVVHVVGGGCTHALGCVCTTDIVHVWFGGSGSYIQATYMFFSIGAIISPFIASPFLSTNTHDDIFTSIGPNNSVLSISNVTEGIDISIWDIQTFLTRGVGNETVIKELNETSLYSDEESKIYVPYTISAILVLLASAAFFTLTLTGRNVYKLIKRKGSSSAANTRDEVHVHEKGLSVGLQRMFVCLQALFILSFLVCERTFCGYLTTYLISLGWDKATGAWANSLYWGCVAFGRLCGVFLVKHVSSTRLIFTFVGLCSLGFIGMTASTFVTSDLLVWASVALSGFGMSIIVATSYSWLSENVVKISGKQTSFTFVVANIGTMTFPLLTGYIMNHFGYEWLVYLVLMSTFVIFLVFSSMVGAYKCVKPPPMDAIEFELRMDSS